MNEKQEVDFSTIKVDHKTKFLLINNPSNPLGTNWSRKHVIEVHDFCAQHNLPIVADETYEEFIFSGEFVSFGSITKKVPIILCSGLTKRFMVPGWRTGWIVLIGPEGAFDEVRVGIRNIISMLGHSNTIVMKKIPEIIEMNQEFSQKKFLEVGERAKLI